MSTLGRMDKQVYVLIMHESSLEMSLGVTHFSKIFLKIKCRMYQECITQIQKG
jgi:hypothetical protein